MTYLGKSNGFFLQAYFICCFFSVSSMAANVEYVEINTEGKGISLQSAVNSALLSAISQVHGKSIESEKLSASMEALTIKSNGEDYLGSESYLEQIKEKTKGAVSSYRILSKTESENGNWQVSLSVSLSKFKRAKRSNRMRVVVNPFSTESSVYTLNDKKFDGQFVATRLSEKISERLIQTRKFTVLDRSFIGEIDKELSITNTEKAHIDESVKQGQKLVADFVLVGSISHLGYVTETKKMRTSDREYTLGQGSFSVSYKVIDVATQQAVFADSSVIKATHKEVPQNLSSEQSPALTYMVKQLAKSLSFNIQNQIYPIAIIANNGDQVVLSQGGNSLVKGEKYAVYKAGEKLYDPYTKEYLGKEESYFGDITIVRVNPKKAYGKLSNTSFELPQKVGKKAFILREKIEEKPVKAKKRKSVKQEQDDNW